VSEYGEVFIYPTEFFAVVGGLRSQTALGAGGDLPAMVVPDVGDSGGTSVLGDLSSALNEARVMMAGNFEIAGRALMLAGTRTIDVDVIESSFLHWSVIPDPGIGAMAPTDDAALIWDVPEFTGAESEWDG
jgi:hypothetical protein